MENNQNTSTVINNIKSKIKKLRDEDNTITY